MEKILIIFAFIATVTSFSLVPSMPSFGVGRTQSAGARGQLLCNGRPAGNVKVKLYDDDRGVDTDDLMAQGTTDGNGNFQLQGYTSEFTTIDPKINVYHDCNDGATPCQRKISIMIPDNYVSSGQRPQQIYNAGSIELAGKFAGEERDCLN
uniref:Transthyretin-like protein 5 n=1 Tax=Panagrolaimus sp. ES5 TaxID=591445 RepID=A0AC34F5I7_9BILA